jgi:SecD/SecF fusion protein
VEKDGGISLVAQFSDSTATLDAKNRTVEVLTTRLTAAGVRNPALRLSPDESVIFVELPEQDSVELFEKLITKPGRFEIVECYTRDEILSVFYEIDSRMAAQPEYAGTEHPLFSRYFFPNNDSFLNTVGYVPVGELTEFEAIMDSEWVEALFPYGAKPAVMKPLIAKSEEEMYDLIVLKYPADGLAPIQSYMIEAAKAGQDYNFYSVVNFRFAKPFHETWARMTRENIGRTLPMVMDGEVYSAPQVNDEIVGGASQITGYFTLEEADLIASILNGSELPTPVKIVSVAVVSKK